MNIDFTFVILQLFIFLILLTLLDFIPYHDTYVDKDKKQIGGQKDQNHIQSDITKCIIVVEMILQIVFVFFNKNIVIFLKYLDHHQAH